MKVPIEQRQQVRFAEYVFDFRTGELWREGTRLLLPHQSFQILGALLEEPGALVTREALVKLLWATDVFVDFEGSLNKAVKRLRESLCDSADTPRFIETLPRRGYRFIEQVSALQAQDPKPAGLVGRRLAHYRVLEVIGGGGMGLVYKAEDLKLGRQVALKFLPDDLASDPIALQRFEREAQTASSLNHPNICTVYEVEDYEGRPCIVMELLQGQTLREWLATADALENGDLLRQLLRVAAEVADALQTAHQNGIIHRDIKPANIFLTSSGQAKILDFGVAKLAGSADQFDKQEASANPGSPTDTCEGSTKSQLTRTGVALGTAGYMSPEQIRGESLDARTDLFSFGLVLYEMATGRQAFNGETAAVVQNAILNDPPTPPAELNPLLPEKLTALINRALEKDRNVRYQSAAQISSDLELVKHILEPPKARPKKSRMWLAATGAMLLLSLSGALYWAWQGRSKLAYQDTVVLADFGNETSDTVLSDALNIALRVELEQTPFLNVLTSDKVRGALKQLGHAEDASLNPELAREVCLHTNSRALAEGSIKDEGIRYRIALKAADCRSGKSLAETEAVAANRNEIVRKLGVAGAQLRAKLGEPGASIEQFNQPLDEATSASPEALHAFAKAMREVLHDFPAAAPYFQHVVELDPNYAIAWGWLGAVRNDFTDDPVSKAAVSRGYELRERMTLRERLLMEHIYYHFITGELDKAARADEQILQMFPFDRLAHINLSAVLGDLAQEERAAAHAREAVRLLPDFNGYGHLIYHDINLDRLDDAKAVFDEARLHNLDGEGLREERYAIAFLQNDQAAMLDQVAWAAGKPGTDGMLWLQSQTEAYHGRLKAAHLYATKAVELRARSDSPGSPSDEDVARYQAIEALRYAEVGDKDRALRQATIVAGKTAGVKLFLALAFARAGDIKTAGELAAAVNQERPLATTVQYYNLPTINAAIALQAGEPTRAIAILQRAAPYDLATTPSFDELYPSYIRGLAYLQLQDGERAAKEFQRLLDHRGVVTNCITGALAYVQLGRAQAMMGDKAAARKSYEDFLTLWKDADPDIPIYQQAKTEYANLH